MSAMGIPGIMANIASGDIEETPGFGVQMDTADVLDMKIKGIKHCLTLTAC